KNRAAGMTVSLNKENILHLFPLNFNAIVMGLRGLLNVPNV
ncbi:MAG: hypothetical protein ACD_45C00051G0001, partial [uncultured bacterium]